jgi:hypothetical protein
MSILKKMKKKWYALNSHRIDEIKDRKAGEELIKIVKELDNHIKQKSNEKI